MGGKNDIVLPHIDFWKVHPCGPVLNVFELPGSMEGQRIDGSVVPWQHRS